MDSFKIETHIKNKIFFINCGDGAQKVKWLGDVAVYRYDKQYGMVTGPPKGVKIENGAVIPLDGIISQNLENGQKVWIQLNDDMDKLHDVKRSQGKNSIKNIMLSKNK